MTAGGVIPEPSERARVAEVGKVTDLSGAPLTVGVRGGDIVLRTPAVSGAIFSHAQVRTLIGLLLDAIHDAAWQAARDKGG